MDVGSVIVMVTGIGCATGVVAMVIDKMSSRGKDQTKLQEARLRQLELENEQLRAQLEWQSRLLTGPATEPASRLQS
jgi:predicted ATPase